MVSRAREKCFLAKFTHLGSFAASFDEKISKKTNVPYGTKIGPLGPQEPIRTPPMDSRAGEKFFLAKFTHLGSFAANFDEKISKNSNFQKWSQMGSHGTPFWTPTGPLGVHMFFWWLIISSYIPPTPNQATNRPNRPLLNYYPPL